MNKKFLSIIISLASISLVQAKTVTLDIVQIYQKYSLVNEANAKFSEAEARFKRLLETAEQEVKDLEAQGKKEEVEQKKDQIQEVIDTEVESLQDEKDFYNSQINRNVARMLQTFAKEQNIDLVLEKGYVLIPIEDITNQFIARLEDERSKEKQSVPAIPATVDKAPSATEKK